MASKSGTGNDQVSRYDGSKLSRHDFPKDFLLGAATSAYQVEGGYAKGGRSLTNWDVFSLHTPGKIADGSNGCVAIDHFNQIQEDVILMKKMGIDCYRFSIAWSRILPAGKLSGGVNREGVKFYNDIIDTLLAQGIEPFVTIWHFDIPQSLEDEYGGFLSPKIIPDFADYAEVCFFEFGDRVKYWITQNEPWTFTHNGYVMGIFPPSRGVITSSDAQADAPVLPEGTTPRCPTGVDTSCSAGNPGTEPYIVAHHLILAHATAVDIYRRNYQAVQGGKIGVTNMTTWYDPYSDAQEDIDAASRTVDFMWGWFVAPIVTGDYPPVMRQRVGSRLPTFTAEETKLITGSYDFLGMNYYTTNWAANFPYPPGTTAHYYVDIEATFYTQRDGVPIGEQAGSSWLFIVPYGLYKLLTHTKNTYNDPIIYITESGVNEKNDKTLSVTQARKDQYRIKAHQEYFAYMKQAIEEGVRLKGYMLWALFDNYEWAEGYTVRFGLYYVDYLNGLTRYPKESAIWYMNFLNKNNIVQPKRLVQVEEIKEDNIVKRPRRGRQ